MSPPSVAIISLGSMGVGIARLLQAHSFPVLTTLQSRSPATKARAKSLDIQCYDTDAELVQRADVVLSIVPPEHALSTARRIGDALKANGGQREGKPMWYVDLNAISPAKAREIGAEIEGLGEMVRLLDGGIIGGPPKRKDDGEWTCPSLVVSGAVRLKELEGREGENLEKVLNMRHVGGEVGKASGLKMCFASMTKGLTAIAIQSFTTAQRLGVHEELVEHLERYSPKTGALVQNSLPGMPPKAYRWIAEMQMINETFRDDGGFDSHLFDEVAKVYDVVAYQTELGKEKTDSRERGLDAEDVAKLMSEGLNRQKKGL